jgi:hypothetical protein
VKAKAIYQLWQEYMHSVRDRVPMVSGQDTVALLFGTDEIKIDWVKNRVKIPEMGWVPTNQPAGTLGKFEWAAMIYKEDQWQLVLSDAPLFTEAVNGVLPSKNGVFLAFPSQRVKEVNAMRAAAGHTA